MAIRSYKGITPRFNQSVYIDESAVLVGDITLGEDSSVWPLVAARGDVNYIRIGERTNVQDGSVLHLTRASKSNPDGYPLIIGDDVTVGHKVMLHGCCLGNRILVGMGAIVMEQLSGNRQEQGAVVNLKGAGMDGMVETSAFGTSPYGV